MSDDPDKARARAEKVVTGPWLSQIPEPDVPLDEYGLRKYHEYTRALFEQGNLTLATKDLAQNAALHAQSIRTLVEKGEVPAMSRLREHSTLLRQLKIAENAPQIAKPTHLRSKFEHSGFPNRRRSKR